MKLKNNKYLRNFIGTAIGVIGSNLILLGFGLNIFQVLDVLKFIFIIIGLLLFVLIIKKIFKWIDVDGIFDGLWIGVALYCWSPVSTLPWIIDFLNAAKASTIYIICGLVVLFIGYKHHQKRK